MRLFKLIYSLLNQTLCVVPLLLSLMVANVHAAFVPKSFIATFEQKYQSRLSKKWKSSKGELSYLFPSRIKLIVNYPEKEIVVSNPHKTWIYTPPFIEGEKGQVIIRDTKTFTPAKFFDFLREGLVSTLNYKVVLKKTQADIKFKQSLQKDLGIKRAELFFKSKAKKFKDLQQVKFILTSGKSKVLNLTSIKVTSALTSKDFSFIVPPNTSTQRE